MTARDCVRVPRVLLPTAEVDPHRWAVIACDQFTSQPEYWEEADRIVGDAPSTLRMVLPESYLEAPDVGERITAAQHAMHDYLDRDLLTAHDAIVYVERTVSGGLQRGLVVELDLDAYDFDVASQSLVRATEGTVLDRIPPRLAVRRGAPLELPHIMVLYDDPDHTVLAGVRERRDDLPVAYDFDLMQGSGHLTGRFIDDAGLAEGVLDALGALVEPEAYAARYGMASDAPLLYAMGDGNHSLATAKTAWEEHKAAGAGPDHPARWALVELVNLHDESLGFEPIHRAVFDAGTLVDDLAAGVGADISPVDSMDAVVEALADASAQRFGIVTADGYAVATVAEPSHQLAVGTLQAFLDQWLADHPDAGIDYLHGEAITDELGRAPGNAGFVLPPVAKESLFRSIAMDGPMPRKTFSMGHAEDKRFYMECRRILPES